jgi:ABC-type nitrate/sulfonate/bicarbonate transport system ATPase subunit
MDKLTVRNISKSYGEKEVLKDVSVVLKENELVCLLGVSGAGKTTLFNIIAGLLAPDSGEVLLDGKDITNQAGNISYMLQKDLLLPYKTIEDNVSLP